MADNLSASDWITLGNDIALQWWNQTHQPAPIIPLPVAPVMSSQQQTTTLLLVAGAIALVFILKR